MANIFDQMLLRAAQANPWYGGFWRGLPYSGVSRFYPPAVRQFYNVFRTSPYAPTQGGYRTRRRTQPPLTAFTRGFEGPGAERGPQPALTAYRKRPAGTNKAANRRPQEWGLGTARR